MSNDLSKLTKEELIELKNKIKNDDNKFISDELDLSKLNFPELDSKSPEIKR